MRTFTAEIAEKSAVIAVTPAKAGVQERSLDSGFRRDDGNEY